MAGRLLLVAFLHTYSMLLVYCHSNADLPWRVGCRGQVQFSTLLYSFLSDSLESTAPSTVDCIGEGGTTLPLISLHHSAISQGGGRVMPDPDLMSDA